MATPGASASVLAWSWVIEALASCREVDLGVLHDLIGANPNLSDNLGKEAREVVALRCLEALYDPAKVPKTGVSLSCSQKEFQFDSSECFSGVLQRVLEETSVSSLGKSSSSLVSLRKGASDQLVREVHAFIEHRKASLPKCALEQLRDRLQKGEVSLVTNLKKSCGPEVQSHSPDKRSKLLDENSPSETLVCLKRDRSCLQTEKQLQDHPTEVESGKSPPGKKLRHDGNGAIASKDLYSAPLCGTETSEDALGRNEPHTECKMTESHEVPMGGREGRTLPDGNEQNILSGEPVQSTGHQTCWQPNVPSEGDKMNVEETSHDKFVNHHEGTFAVITGENPLIPSDLTELDVCMKCKGGGELLICSAGSCQMAVHERCLGFSASTQSRDHFLCPFCACSTAAREYAEAKRKMLLAREQLSLFIGGNPGPGYRQLDQTKGLSNINVHPPVQGKDVDKRTKVSSFDRNLKDKQKGECLVDRVSKHQQQEGHSVLGNTNTTPPKCSSKEKGDDITMGNRQNKEGPRQMHIEHFHYAGLHGGNPKLRHLQRLYDPSKKASCASPGDINETSEAENFKAKPSKNYSRPQSQKESTDQMKDASSASLDDFDGTLQDENCGATTSKYFLRHQSSQKLADLEKNASSVSHDDSDEISEEETCRAIVPKYTLRPQGKETSHCNVYTATALDRRVRVPWTTEEVEMLKEGVKRFASGSMKVIPWKTILEFGSSVFWRGRTSVDLKDKWRNMIRQGQVPS